MWLKRSLLVVSVAFVPLLIGAASPNFVHTLRDVTAGTIRPILEIQDQFTSVIKTQVQSVVEWPKLRQRNRELEERLASVQAELASARELKEENKRLETLLELKRKSEFKTIAARVIGRDPSHWSLFIMLNRGTKDGVREDVSLLSPDGLVGKIVSAGPNSSRAILLTDRQSRVSAINQRTRDGGLIEGTGGLFLKMTFLDRGADIQVGDTIVSSGLGEIYPKGIPIGRVQSVGEDESRLGLSAVVKPFASFAKLEEVLCVLFPPNG